MRGASGASMGGSERSAARRKRDAAKRARQERSWAAKAGPVTVKRVCWVEGCSVAEYEVTVFRNAEGRLWLVGACERHQDVELQPPAGYELYGGGGDPQVVRDVFTGPPRF